jgi:NADH-quinone oxidoreductase subunit M
MQGVVSEKVRKFKDINVREAFAIAPLMVLILFLGIYPKPVIDVINPAIRDTLANVGQVDPVPAAGTAVGGQK